MFRRKEEGLFDNNATDATVEGAEAPAAAQAASAAAPSGQATPSSTVIPPAARPEVRPASPIVSGYRPTTSNLAADLTRSRMPEAKPAAQAAAAPPAAAASNSSFGTPLSEKLSKAGKRILTVGSDILLKGEIATCDRLVIEGKVDATLNDVHTVEIAESGSFKGSATIEDAEISGLFEGELIVKNRLVIYATGKVRGKITYGEIEVERGGELTGDIKTGASAAAPARAARPAYKEEKADA